MWCPSVAVPTNTPSCPWDLTLRHKHPSPTHTPQSHIHTHTLKKQKRAAVWGVGCAGTENGSCENKQQVMSGQQGTLGSKDTFEEVFWGFYFMAAPREGGTFEVELCVCVRESGTHTQDANEEWSEPNRFRETDRERNVGSEENYFQVNSPHCDRQFGLQTGPKCCRCKVTTLPSFLPRSPPHAGKTQRRAGGAQCQMCQVIPADRLRIKDDVCVCDSRWGWKKKKGIQVQSSYVLILTLLFF